MMMLREKEQEGDQKAWKIKRIKSNKMETVSKILVYSHYQIDNHWKRSLNVAQNVHKDRTKDYIFKENWETKAS